MGIVTTATDRHQACIDACTACAQACFECMKACLEEPDVEERTHCIAMLVECALSCQHSAALMSMSSMHAHQHCSLCAEICSECADHCGRFQDDHCPKCAEVCRRCAEECRAMAA